MHAGRGGGGGGLPKVVSPNFFAWSPEPHRFVATSPNLYFTMEPGVLKTFAA